MGLHGAKDIELRFQPLCRWACGRDRHADRAGPFRDYCTGLIMPGERKSVEPMAAITAPDEPRPSISRCCILSVKELGRRCCFDQGAPESVAADYTRRTDRGLDH